MFNLEIAIAAWRRSLEYNRAFRRDDLDELEQHVRDQVVGLVRYGVPVDEAFRRTMGEMGDYGSTEREYQKVYWGKIGRSGELPAEILWRASMLKNYLKVAWRNLLRFKGYASINVIGLAVSMSLCLLILLFIQDQRRHDRFHEKAERIYRVNTQFAHGTSAATSPQTLGSLLREGIAGVEAAVQMKRFGGVVSQEGTNVDIRGLYAEEAFFDVFSFPLAAGDVPTALREPNTIILSDETAAKFFPDQEAIGQVLTLDEVGDVRVTGVLAPMPEHTNLKFDVLVSFATLGVDRQQIDWGHSAFEYYNYVLLREGVAPPALTAQFPDIISRHYVGHPDIKIESFVLQPITGIRLGPMLANQHAFTLPPVIIYALVSIALVVMLTACFNYVSLSVARSLKRAKEVGVRKVVGAHRTQLIAQFVAEALIISLFALAGAFGLLFWLVPAFNQMWIIQYAGTPIAIDFARDVPVLAMFLLFSLTVGLAAGLYPALYLSSFRPVNVLKGLPVFRGATRFPLRKVLTVIQFTFSLLFIVTTLLLYRQANVMLTADYGFDKEQVVNVELQGMRYEPFRQMLERHPQVVQVSATSLLAGTSDGHTEAIWTDEPADPAPQVHIYSADYHFLANMGVGLAAGRNFSPTFSTDSSDAVILNETAIRTLGIASPQEALGETVRVGFAHRPEDAPTYQVVGVVEDYHYFRLEESIGPMMLYYRPERFRFANVRLEAGNLTETVALLEQVWKQYDPVHPFKYQFYDDRLAEEYAVYEDAVGILGVASGFAILIACLGLLGMATYVIEARTKEIGVRKVMGAEVPGLILLLSRDFLKLVGIAIVIGAPLAWFLNNLWLEQFAMRAQFDAWIFAPAILMLLLLSVFTVGSQTIRAALVNPVKTLRYE